MEKAVSSPGRPRNPDLDQAILEVACQHLAEHGYGGMSIEGVALAAGVGKTTIYRRYPHKRALAAAAIASLIQAVGNPPDTGDAFADLVASLEETHQLIQAVNSIPLIGALLVEEQSDPELMDIFREQVIHPRRAQLNQILERGIQRGDLRHDLLIESVIDMLFGAFLGCHLDGRPTTPDWIRSIVQIVWSGIRSS